ncbi:hypothetical protein TNCV_4650131 [Trichonephila clavipes]|nr:hypothetical protein TNCV_4650131 [Trichonephila clavipes]
MDVRMYELTYSNTVQLISGATSYQLLPRSINRQVANIVDKKDAKLDLSPTLNHLYNRAFQTAERVNGGRTRSTTSSEVQHIILSTKKDQSLTSENIAKQLLAAT